MQTGLKDKLALVTGAGHEQGIGWAIACALMASGVRVIITDLKAEEFAVDHNPLAAFNCDLLNADSLNTMIEKITSEYGSLDILVNNAGVGIGSDDFMALTDDDWQTSLNVNVLGTANMIKAVIPNMLAAASGNIINVASMAGLGAIEGIPACYTASKFAVVGLTKQIAQQYASNNIRCNAICPGSIVTQMHAKTMGLIAEQNNCSLEEAQAIENAAIPVGYSAKPEVVGNAATFLASDAASYLTGVALPVAGGMPAGL